MQDGLLVTGVGMGVVFAVLALLMFAIQSLGLFDRVATRRREAALAAATAAAGPALEPPGAPGGISGQVVAAIATALALAEAEASPAGPEPRDPAGALSAGAWAQSGRRRQMEARGRPSR